MSQPFTVLVVCLGNVCRSPLAERLLAVRLAEDRATADAVRVSSAGVRALVGDPMDEHAAAELVRLGGDPVGAVSRQLRGPMAERADLVLTATRELRSRVLEEAPRALKRTFTVPELAALVTAEEVAGDRPVRDAVDLVRRAASYRGAVQLEEYDVPDPIGRSEEVHRQVADLLDDSCTRIARALAAAVRTGADESRASDPTDGDVPLSSC